MNVHFSLEKYRGKEPVATFFFLLLKVNKYSIIFFIPFHLFLSLISSWASFNLTFFVELLFVVVGLVLMRCE